jgi:hypothetical protein
MERRSVAISLTPQIDISEIQGNLQIKGWEKGELLVLAQGESLLLEAQQDQARLECHSNCQINLPVGAQVHIGKVQGNLRIKLLEGSLTVGQVQGNAALRNVAQTWIEEVQGELHARYVNGDIQVERVQGNFKGRDLRGDCSTGQVAGNLDLRDVAGSIEASAGGNARLRLRSLSGDQYQIACGGNLHCRIPEDLGVQFQMASGAESIRVNVPGNMTTISQGSYELTIGDGGVQMSLAAGGSIYLAAEGAEALGADDFDLDLEGEFVELSEEISQQIEEQIESQMEALSSHMANLSDIADQTGLSPEQVDRIMQRAQQSTEKATQRARERMRQAQEKLERKLAEAQRKAEYRARAAQQRDRERRQAEAASRPGSWPRGRGEAETPTSETSEQTFQDERLMILRMLEQKKITPQEAEDLLAALEGK